MWHQMKMLPLACQRHWVQGWRIGWAMQFSAVTLMPPSSGYLANAFTWSSNPKEENIKWSCYKPTPAANSSDPQIWDACTTWWGIGRWDEASTARDIILNQSSIKCELQESSEYHSHTDWYMNQTKNHLSFHMIGRHMILGQSDDFLGHANHHVSFLLATTSDVRLMGHGDNDDDRIKWWAHTEFLKHTDHLNQRFDCTMVRNYILHTKLNNSMQTKGTLTTQTEVGLIAQSSSNQEVAGRPAVQRNRVSMYHTWHHPDLQQINNLTIIICNNLIVNLNMNFNQSGHGPIWYFVPCTSRINNQHSHGIRLMNQRHEPTCKHTHETLPLVTWCWSSHQRWKDGSRRPHFQDWKSLQTKCSLRLEKIDQKRIIWISC